MDSGGGGGSFSRLAFFPAGWVDEGGGWMFGVLGLVGWVWMLGLEFAFCV